MTAAALVVGWCSLSATMAAALVYVMKGRHN